MPGVRAARCRVSPRLLFVELHVKVVDLFPPGGFDMRVLAQEVIEGGGSALLSPHNQEVREPTSAAVPLPALRHAVNCGEVEDGTQRPFFFRPPGAGARLDLDG